MPTPGAAALKAAFGDVAIPVSGFPGLIIDNDSDTITRLSQGMNDGWIPLYPTTVSQCETAIEAAFNSMIGAGWSSRCWLRALGKGIDNEIAAWVASWDSQAGVHTYAPSSASIYASIVSEIGLCGYSNVHAFALAQAVADVWMGFFGQEAG